MSVDRAVWRSYLLSLVGVLLAAVLGRRAARPRRTFVRVTAIPALAVRLR